VLITTKDGTIEYVNPTFCEVTGYSKEEAIGNNPRVLKSGNLSESFYKDLWDTINAGRTWRGDFLNRKKSGEEFWESASISAIKNNEGEITHFVAVKQDITERKHIEEDLKRNVAELEQFSKLAIGREIKMIQLKGEINEYLNKQGLESKYEIVA
jgi:PAS domain S-box-containing protein